MPSFCAQGKPGLGLHFLNLGYAEGAPASLQLSKSQAQQNARSRRDGARGLHEHPSRKGRRESRARQRTRSLACEINKHTSKFTTGSPETPGLPCAMVLTVSFTLFPVTGLDCHRRSR